MLTRFLLCGLLLSGSVVGLTQPARAQTPVLDEARSKLAGETSREWLAGDVRTWMGSDAPCTFGERYRFYKDNTVSRESCEAGVIQKEDTSWSISADGPLDVIIEVGEDSYLLIFYEDPAKLQHMILRTRGDAKVEPNVDREFVLSED